MPNPPRKMLSALFITSALAIGCGARVSFECPSGSVPRDTGCESANGNGNSSGSGGNGSTESGNGATTGNGGGGAMSSSGGAGSGAGTGGASCADPETVSWSRVIAPSDSVIGLCGGTVMVGNKIKNRVDIIDITTNNVIKNWQLDASPGDIVLDTATNTAYVALIAASRIAKVNLNAPDVQTIVLEAPAVRLALGNDGIVFATRALQSGVVGKPITIIDGPSATVKTTLAGDFDTLIAFDRAGNYLITGDKEISPSRLTRYSFDPAALTLTFEQDRGNAGGGGWDIAISPDGNHIAFPCGGGNGPVNSIVDFDAHDFNTTYGAWPTMPQAISGAFSNDGTKFVAGNSKDILVFDAQTHALIHAHPATYPGGGCTLQNLDRVSVSPSGGIYYAISKCGTKNEDGRLFWYVP